MNASEKVAWTELLVSVVAIVAVVAIFPWLGNRAFGAMGVLGIVGLTPLFLRRRGDEIVSDERDANIALRANFLGVHAAWMLLAMSLIAITMWHSHYNLSVPTKMLNMLIWIQFATFLAVKGATSLYMYRGSRRAA